MSNKIIRIKNMHKEYDSQVIFKNFNLDIIENEIIVILGYSGIGKSTLLRIIARLDKKFDGEVIYSDELISNNKISLPVVFQNFDQLFPWYTGKENIQIPYEKTGINDEYLNRIINKLGLKSALNKFPNQLSGGMKQRVAIARALLSDSKVILMDEPFGSLDIVMRRELQGLIRKIKEEFNKTIVFITHDIEEAVFIADRILILKSENRYLEMDVTDLKKERYTKEFDKKINEIINKI